VSEPTTSTPDPGRASLVVQMLLLETYGLRLGVPQLAEVLGISKGAIYNQISANTFAVETYVDGGKRWADYRDVAAHLERCRTAARAEHEQRRIGMIKPRVRLPTRAH
jgi:hypothetical protein